MDGGEGEENINQQRKQGEEQLMRLLEVRRWRDEAEGGMVAGAGGRNNTDD